MRESMKVCMSTTFYGVNGFEKYRPHIEIILSSVSKLSLIGFRLAINEAISNAIRYGDSFDDAKVAVNIRFNRKIIIAKIQSFNNGFNVKEYVENFYSNPSANVWDMLKKKSRGRGLWLMLSGSERVIFSADGKEVILVTRVSDIFDQQEAEKDSTKLLAKVYIV